MGFSGEPRSARNRLSEEGLSEGATFDFSRLRVGDIFTQEGTMGKTWLRYSAWTAGDFYCGLNFAPNLLCQTFTPDLFASDEEWT
jgi:hypothetical protein